MRLHFCPRLAGPLGTASEAGFVFEETCRQFSDVWYPARMVCWTVRKPPDSTEELSR